MCPAPSAAATYSLWRRRRRRRLKCALGTHTIDAPLEKQAPPATTRRRRLELFTMDEKRVEEKFDLVHSANQT